MRELGIQGVVRGKCVITTLPDGQAERGGLVDRDFVAAAPNRCWGADCLGQEVPGDRPAPGERVGGVHPVPPLDTEIRRIVCTTNAIDSVSARNRRAVKARGHFPNEASALKCVYTAIMSLDLTGNGQARWTMRWKTALNAFDITFDGWLSAARQ